MDVVKKVFDISKYFIFILTIMPRSHILVFILAYRPYMGGVEIALEEIARRLPQYFFTVI